MIDNTNEYIICAAIWYQEIELARPEAVDIRGMRPTNISSGIVLCGWRHSSIINNLVGLTGLRSVTPVVGQMIQGFLTSKNRFLNRKEAATLALECGQINELQYFKDQLDSSDLY